MELSVVSSCCGSGAGAQLCPKFGKARAARPFKVRKLALLLPKPPLKLRLQEESEETHCHMGPQKSRRAKLGASFHPGLGPVIGRPQNPSALRVTALVVSGAPPPPAKALYAKAANSFNTRFSHRKGGRATWAGRPPLPVPRPRSPPPPVGSLSPAEARAAPRRPLAKG